MNKEPTTIEQGVSHALLQEVYGLEWIDYVEYVH